MAQRFPRLHGVLDYGEEAMAGMMLLLEWHNLRTHGTAPVHSDAAQYCTVVAVYSNFTVNGSCFGYMTTQATMQQTERLVALPIMWRHLAPSLVQYEKENHHHVAQPHALLCVTAQCDVVNGDTTQSNTVPV